MAEEVRKESYNGQKEENNILTSYDEKIDEIVGSRDTVTISKEEYETLKNSKSYSTTEKEVGTWIDGSKLYRITINKTMNFNGNKWYEFDLGLSKYNIKKLINADYVGGTIQDIVKFSHITLPRLPFQIIQKISIILRHWNLKLRANFL